VKYDAAFVGELSGSVGGLTASRAKGGVNYFRFKANPTNPNSARQAVVRQAFTQLSQTWELGLTSTQRDSWINEAAGSVTQGLNLYQQANVFRIQAGLSRIDELLSTAIISPSAVVVAQTLGAGRSITFDNADTWANEDDAGLLVYETRPIPPSRTFENRERLLGVVLGDSGTAPTSPQAETSPWGNLGGSGDESRYRGLVTFASGRFVSVPIAAITLT
jgi:hypothetical protein